MRHLLQDELRPEKGFIVDILFKHESPCRGIWDVPDEVASRSMGQRCHAGISCAAFLFMFWCNAAVSQIGMASRLSGRIYTTSTLSFRYTSPKGMRDKTERFRAQIAEAARSSGKTQALSALLALSSGSDGNAPDWGSVTIETYPRGAVSELDDSKAEAEMNARVAHSKDSSALPKSAVISGQKFTVSVFGLREGTVTKGAVVWTTVRKGKLLSFAFAANSPTVLRILTESMKTVAFF